MDEKTKIWSLLSSFLNKDATENEKQLIENWIAENEKNASFFHQLNTPQDNTAIEEKALSVKDLIYVKTQAKIKQKALRFKLRLWKSIAAALIAVLVTTGAVVLFKDEMRQPLLMETQTPVGANSKLILSDGTLVNLNASSKIFYPTSFEGNTRTIKLDGEAYFEVKQDKKHPFIVETNGLIITVLGTHFNVKSYQEDGKVITSLLEGAVSIELSQANANNNKLVILHPNQQLVFDKFTKQIEIKDVKADLYASWKDGQCFFENETFSDIVKILERQFGVTINITTPALENQLYSGFFTKKEGIEQILNSFKKYRRFDYKQSDAGIEIYEK